MTVTQSFFTEAAKLTGHGLGGTAFDFVAIGSGSTAPAATQTALVTELTGSGSDRAAATGSIVTTTFTGDTMQFVITYAFTGSKTVREFGVFNASSAGTMMLRQTFAADLFVVTNDTLTLTIKNVVTMPTNDSNGSLPDQVLTQVGIKLCNRLFVLDEAYSTRYRYLALGSDAGSSVTAATTLTAAQPLLGTEITANGLGRLDASTGTGNSISTVTTTTTNDTTRWTGQWSVTGTQAVNECAVFETATNGTGNALVRHIFTNPENLVNTDTYTLSVDVQNS